MRIKKETGEFCINENLTITKLSNLEEFKEMPQVKISDFSNGFSSVNFYNLHFENLSFRLGISFKNNRFYSMRIFIEEEVLGKLYGISEKGIDQKTYLNDYLNFRKGVLDNLVSDLIESKKRNFNWGKIRLLVSPWDYIPFIEIKYW